MTTNLRSLPAGFSANLGVYSMDQLATAKSIIRERLHATPRGSVASSRWMNLAAKVDAEVFDRGFRTWLRSPDLDPAVDGVFLYERFRPMVVAS